MKKLIALLLVFAFALTACSSEEQKENPDAQIQNNTVTEEDKKPMGPVPEVFAAGTGKFGLKFGKSVVIQPFYDKIEIHDRFVIAKNQEVVRIFSFDGKQKGVDYNILEPSYDWEKDYIIYHGIVTDGTMLKVDFENEPVLKEVPARRYYLINEKGEPLADVPLEDYEIWDYNEDTNTIYIVGTNRGNRYEIERTETGSNVAVTISEEEPSEFIDEFGYKHTGYHYTWFGGNMGVGLTIDGEVFLEPVYSGIEVPFKDRVMLKYSAFMQCLEGGYCKIIDLEKNVLSGEFNSINFTKLNNGWYIGIARNAGEYSEDQIFDKNGNPTEKGMWFVNKDGNIISPKIEGIKTETYNKYLGYQFDLPPITSVDDVITVLDENGEEITVKIKDYAFKP